MNLLIIGTEDTFLLLDALEADEKQLKELNPSVCLEIGYVEAYRCILVARASALIL